MKTCRKTSADITECVLLPFCSGISTDHSLIPVNVRRATMEYSVTNNGRATMTFVSISQEK